VNLNEKTVISKYLFKDKEESKLTNERLKDFKRRYVAREERSTLNVENMIWM
jgi:hypothetical protein